MADQNDVGIGSFMQDQITNAMGTNAAPLTVAAAAPGPTFNAATGPNLTAAPSNYVTPPQLGTPSTPSGGSFTQGAALPNITTTQQQATAAPAWYMDYLNNLAGASTAAGANAQYVGAQPLQQQAFNQTAANVGNYQPALNQAYNQLGQAGGMSAMGAGANVLNQSAAMSGAQAGANLLNQSAGMSGAQAGQAGINAAMQTAPSNVQSYMNPYINSVVDEAGRLGLQNIRNTISPQATAGAVGSGQFGSTRGANVLGQNITGALQTLGGQQQGLLASGYQNAITSSQADMARQLQAGLASGQLTQADATRLAQIGQMQGQLTQADATRLAQIGQMQGQLTSADIASRLQAAQNYGALGTTTQNLGMGDVNALSTMGGQQQQMAQNQQLFPLQVAAQQAALMKGFTIPTSVSSTYTGPIPGAYQTSPLMQLGSLGSGIAGLFQTPSSGGASTITNIGDWLSKTFGSSGGGNITSPVGNTNPATGNTWADDLAAGNIVM
jgi:hypothetical protein